MKTILRPVSLAAALALTATASWAAAQFDVYGPPNNTPLVAISGNGPSGVTAQGGIGNVYLASSPGSFTAIGGNSSTAGFNSGLGISGNGLLISGNATAANGFSQAALYSVTAGTWTTLGSLGFNSTSNIGTTGIKQQGWANAISSDGTVVVGAAYYNTTGTTGTRTHPVVYRGGMVIDLNPAATTQTGTALATNRDGSVVSGYNSNSSIGSIWTWNGSAYVASNPMLANPNTGTMVGIQAARLSDNGVWAAGGSVNGLATNYAPTGTFPTITFSPATLWNTQTNSGLLIPFDHVIDTSVGGTDPIRNMKASVAGVSDQGTVIGTFDQCLSCTTGILQQNTWIYSATTGVTLSFDAYLASLGLPLAPTQHVWQLYGMSADGSAISGMYYDTATSTSSAFLLHTIAIPEPATWLMFALALPLIARRVARRAAAET